MKSHGHPSYLLTATLLLLALAAPGAAAHADAQPAPPAPELDLPASDTPADGADLLVLETGAVNQCIQITVWAYNPETGECREFGSPCSVPSGWQVYWFDPTCGGG